MDSQLRKTHQCQKTVMVLHLQWKRRCGLAGWIVRVLAMTQQRDNGPSTVPRILSNSCYSIGPAANPSAVISCHLIRCYYTSCLHIIWFHNNSHSCQEGWLWFSLNFRGTMSKPIVDDFSFQIFGIVCQAWLWIPSQTRLERLPPRLPVVDPPLLRLINY